MSAKKKHAGGRPSSYDPSYCALVIEHMRNGMSIASFAAKVGVSRETIWKWGKAYPEFRNACEVAKETSQVWWERLAIAIATGQHKSLEDENGVKRFENANAGMVMFLMSRRFADYHDKSRILGMGFDDKDNKGDEETTDEEDLNARIAKQIERYNARSQRKAKTVKRP